MKRLFLALALLLLATPAFADNPIYRFGTTHVLNYTGTSSAITNQLGLYIGGVRITCTTACYWASAASPGTTAQAVALGSTSHYLPANTPVEVMVDGGGKIAVIQVSSGGTLFVTELSK